VRSRRGEPAQSHAWVEFHSEIPERRADRAAVLAEEAAAQQQ
jgi:hypothetical protein